MCASLLFKLSVPDDFFVQVLWLTYRMVGAQMFCTTLLPDKTPRFPINKMPMGLVEYTALFFLYLTIYSTFLLVVQANFRQWTLA